MSEARARLWKLIRIAGPANLLYVDTDSLIVTAQGDSNLHQAQRDDRTYSLVRKAPITTLTIHGPRNIEVQNERRISGVPTKATRTGPLQYEGQVWTSVKQSMRSGTMDHVLVTPRTYNITPDDPRRHHNPDGTTTPHHIEEHR